MKERKLQDSRLWKWSTLASLALHSVFCIFLLFFVDVPKLKPVQQQSVIVEIVMAPRTPSPLSAPPPRTPALESSKLPQGKPDDLAAIPKTQPTPPQLRDNIPVLVKPSHMLSETILADPRSQKARRMMARLSQSVRIGQLCGLEAMAQVAAWKNTFKPDKVVAYATADTKILGNTLLAEGAALHSKEEWFRLKFRCGLTPDHTRVTSFEFLVGKTIPRSDWENHNLPSKVDSLD
jgi:hypothetical protein